MVSLGVLELEGTLGATERALGAVSPTGRCYSDVRLMELEAEHGWLRDAFRKALGARSPTGRRRSTSGARTPAYAVRCKAVSAVCAERRILGGRIVCVEPRPWCSQCTSAPIDLGLGYMCGTCLV
eukprot:IDg2589t1